MAEGTSEGRRRAKAGWLFGAATLTLTVSRGGRIIQTEPLLAWTVGGMAGAEG